MDSSSILLSPRSIVFWRHVVGIAIVLLAQHPARYANGMMFLGLWFGTLIIALGVAGLVTSLGYLFFTTRTKGKAWRIFVVIAWTIAVFQLFGEWFLPTIVNNIASTSPMERTSEVAQPSNPVSSGLNLENLSDAPLPQKPTSQPSFSSDGWTQESTSTTKVGAWIKHSPPGTRYCRYANGIIIRLYPPGVRPYAEEANPFCLRRSIEYVPPQPVNRTTEEKMPSTWDNYPGAQVAKPSMWKKIGEVCQFAGECEGTLACRNGVCSQ